MEWRLQEHALDYARSDYIPPGHQAGWQARIDMVLDLVKSVRKPADSVCDVGCNAGHFLELVGPPCWGYDIAEGPLSVGRDRGLDVRAADIMTDELELAPIVTVTEVLEHLEDPHGLIDRLNRAPVRCLVASGPALETPEQFYEQHVWAWDLEGFAKLFTDRGFTVPVQATSDIFQALVAYR